MDNIKTGNLIREARKEKGLTQLELAELLHVSDRAVSKWERGLCAPDIALLEPLTEALGLTLTELISGERSPAPDTETAVKEAISYSRSEISQRSKTARRKIIAIGLAAAILAAAVCLGFMWYKGLFYIIGRYPSPDGSIITTVYSRSIHHGGPPKDDGFSAKDTGRCRGITGYPGAEFRGLWWSPSGQCRVVSIYGEGESWFGEGETILFIDDYSRNMSSNLDMDLDRAIYGNGFFADVPEDEEWAREDIQFEFVQWSGADPDKMLIYFSYFDGEMDFREGYMWYDYESGEVSGEMEIEQGEKETDFIHKMWDEIMN